MGVWIETESHLTTPLARQSHPVWVCGLKRSKTWRTIEQIIVTPCMGVWIETRFFDSLSDRLEVTPCMGVWIETLTLSPLEGVL